MRILAALLLLCLVSPSTAHDTDFPRQMQAINGCYISLVQRHITGQSPRVTAALVDCMKHKGFEFCPRCVIADVGKCSTNAEAKDHPDCYRERLEDVLDGGPAVERKGKGL